MHRGIQYAIMAVLVLLGVALVVVGVVGMTRIDKMPQASSAAPLPDPSVSVAQQGEESGPLAAPNTIEPSPVMDAPRGQSPAASSEAPGPQGPARPAGDTGRADTTTDDGGKEDKQLLDELEACCKAGDIDGVGNIVAVLEKRSSLKYLRWLSQARYRKPYSDSPRKDEVLGVFRRSAASVFQRGGDVPPGIRKSLLSSWLRVDEERTKTGPEWEAKRRESARLWLGVHEEIAAKIDWDWKFEEPEAFTVPETPAERNAHWQRLERLMLENSRQHKLRWLRKDGLLSVPHYIATIYSMEPLAPAELERLLSTVSDKELKQRILKEVARRTSNE